MRYHAWLGHALEPVLGVWHGASRNRGRRWSHPICRSAFGRAAPDRALCAAATRAGNYSSDRFEVPPLRSRRFSSAGTRHWGGTMSLRRSRFAIATAMSVVATGGLAFAGSSGATTPDTVVDTSGTTAPDSIVETSAPATSESAVVEILPPDESWARSDPWRVGCPVVAMGGQHARGRQPMLRHDRRTLRIRTVRAGLLPAGELLDETEITCVVAEGTAIYVTWRARSARPSNHRRSSGETRTSCGRAPAQRLDGVTDYRGPRQRTRRRRPGRVSDRFTAVHAHLPGEQHLRGGAGRGAGGVGGLQLHHRPTAARRIRDRLVDYVRRRARAR